MSAEEYERFRNDPKNVKFTRPVYPYPLRGKVQGSRRSEGCSEF